MHKVCFGNCKKLKDMFSLNFIDYSHEGPDSSDLGEQRLLFLGHRSLIRNRTQTVVINIFSLLVFNINLTFRMLLNIHFQKYRYNFENYYISIVFKIVAVHLKMYVN